MNGRKYIHKSGFFTSSANDTEQIPFDAMIEGSENVVFRDNGVLGNFNGHLHTGSFGGSITNALEAGWASLGQAQDGAGNVMEYINKSLMFVGNGMVKVLMPSVNTIEQTIGTATSQPQIAVRKGTGWMMARKMGLSIPSGSPILSSPAAKSSGFTGLLTGSYSAKFAKRRSETGALSIASSSSNVMEFTNSSAVLEIPPNQDLDGTDRIRIYFTPKGFGSISGSHLQLPVELLLAQVYAGTVNESVSSENNGFSTTVKVKSIAVNKIEIEFNDQDLLPTEAPIDQFAPTVCSFISRLGNQVIYLGTFGGLGISSAIPNEPESVPPSLTTFVSEPILGVSRPVSGFLYVLCRNSIWIAVLSGAVEGSPVIARPLVTDLGILNQRNAASVGDELYGFSAAGLPFVINSEGAVDKSFGNKALDVWKRWKPADVNIGYDEKYDRVIYSHGREQMAFDRQYDRWCAPINFDNFLGNELLTAPAGTVASTFTQEGVLHIVMHNAGVYKMYLFDKGTSGSIYKIKTNWDAWDAGFDVKHILYYRNLVRIPNLANLNFKVFKDFGTIPVRIITLGIKLADRAITNYKPVGAYHLQVFSTELSSQGLGHQIHSQELWGEVSGMMPR